MNAPANNNAAPATTAPVGNPKRRVALTGIAVAVLLIDPLVGIAFLVLAVLISVGRVIVGEHYPGDVLAGAAIGSLSALVVVQLARPLISFLVRLVERVTDPVLRPVWRR